MIIIILKYWIAKFKILTKIALLILVVVTFYLGYEILRRLFSGADSNTIGAYGALFGALLGGVISLLGSVWVHNRQLKSMAEIKRKEEIYTPLYDELIKINNILFKHQPYPQEIIINEYYPQDTSLPTYSEWLKIKNSTYYLQLPEILKNKMAELFEVIADYNEAFNEAHKELVSIWMSVAKYDVFAFEYNQEIHAFKEILKGKKVDYFRHESSYGDLSRSPKEKEEKKKMFEELQNKIEVALYDNVKVSVVRAIYIVLEKTQKEIIEILEFIIKTTIQKYEK